MEEKFYTVSEISKRLEVPRTTVNDWLTKYKQYIGAVKKGKRKFYPESSLDILKDISELRDRDLSSAEIEKKLAHMHPLHGEISGQIDGDSFKKDVSEPRSEDYDRNKSSLISRENHNQLASLFSSQFNNFTDKYEDLEKESRKAFTSAALWKVSALILFIFILLVFSAGYYFLNQYRKELLKTDENKEKLLKELIQKDSSLKFYENRNGELKNELDALKVNSLNEKKKLQREIEQYRKDFREMLNKMQSDSRRKELKLLSEREKFASQRLELLKKLEKVIMEGQKKNVIINRLNELNKKQSETLNAFSEEKNVQKDSATAGNEKNKKESADILSEKK